MQRQRIRLKVKAGEIGEVKQQSVTWSPHLNMGYAKAAQSLRKALGRHRCPEPRSSALSRGGQPAHPSLASRSGLPSLTERSILLQRGSAPISSARAYLTSSLTSICSTKASLQVRTTIGSHERAMKPYEYYCLHPLLYI